MSVRHATDQPLAAWATAAKPPHFSIGRSLVDEHQTGRIKHALLSNPATARPSDVCSFLLRRAQAFLRNGHSRGRRHGLEHEAEGLGAPMQIVDDPRAVADLVRRRARVDVIHTVTHGIVEENRYLARGSSTI